METNLWVGEAEEGGGGLPTRSTIYTARRLGIHRFTQSKPSCYLVLPTELRVRLEDEHQDLSNAVEDHQVWQARVPCL